MAGPTQGPKVTSARGHEPSDRRALEQAQETPAPRSAPRPLTHEGERRLPLAGACSRTTVTIKAEGTDLSGLVKSPKPRLCAKNRKVVVIKQIGARGGGDDVKFASDTASRQNGVYAWSTGNTGTQGKFYARVRRTPDCKGDTSGTIVARR